MGLYLRRSGVITVSSIVAMVVLVVLQLIFFKPPKNTKNTFTKEREAIWDAEINDKTEAERCRRYGYSYDSSRKIRRRVFMGSLIADDSWGPLEASSVEAYGIYTSVVFVESNMTQALFTRKMRFLPGSENRRRVEGLYGLDTPVHVNFLYTNTDKLDTESWFNVADTLLRENLQREEILKQWQKDGMRPDDIGVVQDVDETFTRDFLRAAQICDLPQFRPGQDCKSVKILAHAMVFESTPDCITQERGWYHPDMMIGECINRIGNNTVHPPLRRSALNGTEGQRPEGYGGNYNNSFAKSLKISPLHNAWDFRSLSGGVQPRLGGLSEGGYDWDTARTETGQPTGITGYHFHNFFDQTSDIRTKYRTYGHPNNEALSLPLAELSQDLRQAVNCALNQSDDPKAQRKFVIGGLDKVLGPKPIYFTKGSYRKNRTENFKKLIREDVQRFGS